MTLLPATARCLIATAIAAGVPPVQQDAGEQVWAGHQVVLGERSIAVIGSVQTRTDSYVLAHVRRRGKSLELRQSACAVRFAEVAGVETRMRPSTVARLPAAAMTLEPGPAESWRAVGAVTGWGDADVDADGHPGATVVVDSALCGGELYVGSRTTTGVDGHMTDDGFVGVVRVRVQQTIFGADGWCLSKAASDTDELQQGRVAYTRVAASTSCATLAQGPWPVAAGLGEGP